MSQKSLVTDHAAPQRLTQVTILGSALLALALAGVYLSDDSQLALAQAADSLFDTIGGLGLLWAIHHSRRPADAEHPQGHMLAQPVAALVVAVLSGVLAAEVLRASISALLSGARPRLDWPMAAVYLAKILFKGAIVAVAGRLLATRRSPTLAALRVDARNDMLVGGLAILGFLLERRGLSCIDPLLASGVALYIAYSGLRLGRENASLLLGESASAERQRQLLSLAREVTSVSAVSGLLAVWHGSRLHVQLTAAVDEALPLRAAHQIGHAIEAKLLAEPDVESVSVHLEPLSPIDD